MKEYIIVGDTERNKGCLVALAGRTLEGAQEKLDRMINNPTDNDKALMKGHTNLRIEETKSEENWWNW